MKFLTDYLNKVSDAIKIINSDTNDDSVINDTLYFHMVKRHLCTGRRSIIDIRRHVGNLYKEKSHPLMADQLFCLLFCIISVSDAPLKFLVKLYSVMRRALILT